MLFLIHLSVWFFSRGLKNLQQPLFGKFAHFAWNDPNGKKTNGRKTRIFKACLDSIFLFNVELWTRPYQIWSKLSDLRQTFPKVVSGVQSNTCEISGQLKKSFRRCTSIYDLAFQVAYFALFLAIAQEAFNLQGCKTIQNVPNGHI